MEAIFQDFSVPGLLIGTGELCRALLLIDLSHFCPGSANSKC
jgi:hypothetical protein